MICFDSVERDHSLSKGDDTAKIFSCMIHSDRSRTVNELPTISASMYNVIAISCSNCKIANNAEISPP